MSYSQDTEAAIVKAATEAFLEKGKAGARMQDIADRAGINKALLHYYFRSKDRLYEKVFDAIIQSFLGNLLEAIAEIQDIKQMLRSFINNYIDTLAAHPGIVRFVIWEINQGGQSFANAARKVFAQYGYDTVPLISKFDDAVKRGSIRPIDPAQLTISLMGLCLYPFVAAPIIERLINGLDVYSVTFLNQRKDEVFRLIWEGISRDDSDPLSPESNPNMNPIS